MVVTTGDIGRGKLQSNHHHQQTNIQFFYRPDGLPVLTRACFYFMLFCAICVFCLLVVLVRLSVPVQTIDWKDSSLK